MKKKIRISIITVVVAALLVWAVPALAAHVGSLRAQAEIQESIIIEQSEEVVAIIFAGQEINFEADVRNIASLPYGLRFYGFLYWYWGGKAEEVIEIPIEELQFLDGEATIELESVEAGGGPIPLGKIHITIEGEDYEPGKVINIEPEGVLHVEVSVVTDPSIDPGSLRAEVLVFRGAPITYLS